MINWYFRFHYQILLIQIHIRIVYYAFKRIPVCACLCVCFCTCTCVSLCIRWGYVSIDLLHVREDTILGVCRLRIHQTKRDHASKYIDEAQISTQQHNEKTNRNATLNNFSSYYIVLHVHKQKSKEYLYKNDFMYFIIL